MRFSWSMHEIMHVKAKTHIYFTNGRARKNLYLCTFLYAFQFRCNILRHYRSIQNFPCVYIRNSNSVFRRRRRAFHAPNALRRINNKMQCPIIHCSKCVWRMRSATFNLRLSFPRVQKCVF